MKKQDKAPQKQLSKMEIGNLPEKAETLLCQQRSA